jgi:hypothetical protein
MSFKKIRNGLTTVALATTLFANVGCSKKSPTPPKTPTEVVIPTPKEEEKPKITTPQVIPIKGEENEKWTPIVIPPKEEKEKWTPITTTPTTLNSGDLGKQLLNMGFELYPNKKLKKSTNPNQTLEKKILFYKPTITGIETYSPSGVTLYTFGNKKVMVSNEGCLTQYERKKLGSEAEMSLVCGNEVDVPIHINNSNIMANFKPSTITLEELTKTINNFKRGEHKAIYPEGLNYYFQGGWGKQYDRNDPEAGPSVTQMTFSPENNTDTFPTELEIHNEKGELVEYLHLKPDYSSPNTFNPDKNQMLGNIPNGTYILVYKGEPIGVGHKGKLTHKVLGFTHCPEETGEFINDDSKPNTYNNCS